MSSLLYYYENQRGPNGVAIVGTTLFNGDFSPGNTSQWTVEKNTSATVTVYNSSSRPNGGASQPSQAPLPPTGYNYAAKFYTYGSDTDGANVRSQVRAASEPFQSGDDAYFSFYTYFPTGFPVIDSGVKPNDYFMFFETFGPPFTGSPNGGLMISADNHGGVNKIVSRFGTGPSDGVEQWTGPTLTLNKWYHFIVHKKFSQDPTVGFIEIWMDGVKQTFNDGTTRWYVATQTSGETNSYFILNNYFLRYAHPDVTIYHAGGRAYSSLDQALAEDAPSGGTGGGGGGGTGGTLMAADWADDLVDTFGVNLHTTYTPPNSWQQPAPGDASSQATILRTLQYMRCRHVRDNIGIGNSRLRATHDLLWANGIDVMFTAGIFGYLDGSHDWPSASSFKTEIVNNYDLNQIYAVEGINEPDNFGKKYANAEWVSVTKQYQADLWNAFHPIGVTVLPPPMAGTTYTYLGNLNSVSDKKNLHIYPGGSIPSTVLSSGISSSEAQNPGYVPLLSESGFHTTVHYGGSHKYTPADVCGVYAPRELLECYIRGVERQYFYALMDDKRDDDQNTKEANFGMFAWGIGFASPQWTPKPHATSMRNFMGVMADPQTTRYKPAGFPITVTGGDASTKYRLFGKKNGTYQLVLWRDISIWVPSTTADAGHYPSPMPASIPITVTFNDGSTHTIQTYKPSTQSGIVSTATAVNSTVVSLNAEVVVLNIIP